MSQGAALRVHRRVEFDRSAVRFNPIMHGPTILAKHLTPAFVDVVLQQVAVILLYMSYLDM